jgi:hypothetical protein
MQPTPSTAQSVNFSTTVQVDPVSRWTVYHRLAELAIPCRCAYGQPLQVQITTAIAAVQLWSVIQQVTAPRSTQVDWLTRCFQAS